MDEHIITKKKKTNTYKIATAVLAILLIVSVVYNVNGFTGASVAKVEENLNSYLDNVPGLTGAEISEIQKDGCMFTGLISIQGQAIPVYVSGDGETMFPTAIPLVIGEPAEVETPTPTEVPKSDKPEVELFVMSFCPYGTKGEQVVKPAYDLLKDDVDFKVRFFATPQGATIEDVRSLHGNLEAQEDARQVCIDKYYPNKLWNYLMEIANNCPTAYKDEAELESCWKAAAETTGIDISQIEDCYANEVDMILDRFTADGALISKYGLSGSESLVVNGVKVSAGDYRWSADKVKTIICSAFNTPAGVCSTTLDDGEEGSVQGSC